MTQPKGYKHPKYPDRVCKFVMSIYGLEQASRSWNIYFHEKSEGFGFPESKWESDIYVKASGSIIVF